ncbi:hypothetical protein [Planococcus maitriensis]|nr:hypothetical protein [Planococcus maitriensis]
MGGDLRDGRFRGFTEIIILGGKSESKSEALIRQKTDWQERQQKSRLTASGEIQGIEFCHCMKTDGFSIINQKHKPLEIDLFKRIK